MQMEERTREVRVEATGMTVSADGADRVQLRVYQQGRVAVRVRAVATRAIADAVTRALELARAEVVHEKQESSTPAEATDPSANQETDRSYTRKGRRNRREEV